MPAYDLAVIGAGINGAGIARDAALRGLHVVILDQDDLCSGTSAVPSRLIHGGLRYLEYGEIPLVFESLRERITLRHIAPHLVRPLRICIPVYAGAKRGPLTIRLGMIAYDLLSVGKSVPGHEMLGRDEILAVDPGLRAEGLRAAARYYDAQVAFVERLVLENLLAARSAGADVRTHCRVSRLDIDGGRVRGLAVRDMLTGATSTVEANVIVNAAGPWVDAVLASAGRPLPPLIGGTKGSHIVVGPFAGAPGDAYYAEAAEDNRPFFIIPWNGQYLIGTTDIRYDGSLDKIRASGTEVDYLLRETNRVFPAAHLERRHIHYAYAGVRPLPYRERGPESAITRRHIIRDNRELADGLVSVIGGKLTTYRNLAEQVVDRVGKVLGRRLPECRTAGTLLPGAYRIDDARAALAAREKLSASAASRLLDLYGGRVLELLALADSESSLSTSLDEAGNVLAAEVVFAIRTEWARTLEDIVYRRLMTGLDADQGRPLYEKVAAIAAGEFGWDVADRHAALAKLRAYSDSFLVPGRQGDE